MCNKSNKREKISLFKITQMFPNDDVAEEWFIQNRWENGVTCAFCDSTNVTQRTTAKKSWRCKECRKDFSTKTNTVMQGSNLGFRVWAMAIYLITTSLKGIASTKLASDLGITQKSAWHLSMRIREAYMNEFPEQLEGVVEIDETYIGGKEKNKHKSKRVKGTQGRSLKTKTVIFGMKSRSGKVYAKSIENLHRKTVSERINQHVKIGSTISTDEARFYKNIPNYHHISVDHSVGQYVSEMASTNGIESFWSLLKRGYIGVHHFMSRKHINRYVGEFAQRHNNRPLNTINQMNNISKNMVGVTLPYQSLIAA
jgi:transposase-like protein